MPLAPYVVKLLSMRRMQLKTPVQIHQIMKEVMRILPPTHPKTPLIILALLVQATEEMQVGLPRQRLQIMVLRQITIILKMIVIN